MQLETMKRKENYKALIVQLKCYDYALTDLQLPLEVVNKIFSVPSKKYPGICYFFKCLVSGVVLF